MPEQSTLVDIKGLRTYFYLAEGVVRAVDGVDLKIKRQKTLGIVGESGCGKSIMSLSLLRLVPPPGKIEEGEILYYKTVKQEKGNPNPNLADVINITSLDSNSQILHDIRGNQI